MTGKSGVSDYDNAGESKSLIANTPAACRYPGGSAARNTLLSPVSSPLESFWPQPGISPSAALSQIPVVCCGVGLLSLCYATV